MGMFDNIAKDAENLNKTDSAPFIGIGKYDLRVDDVTMGTSNKSGKNYIFMNLTVLGVVEGSCHEAGGEETCVSKSILPGWKAKATGIPCLNLTDKR